MISTRDLAARPDPASVYRHEPLSPSLRLALGSQRDHDAVAIDAVDIGYPLTPAAPG